MNQNNLKSELLCFLQQLPIHSVNVTVCVIQTKKRWCITRNYSKTGGNTHFIPGIGIAADEIVERLEYWIAISLGSLFVIFSQGYKKTKYLSMRDAGWIMFAKYFILQVQTGCILMLFYQK